MDHSGRATWGDRLVSLDAFAEAARASGRELDAASREAEREGFLTPATVAAVVEARYERVLVFGGVYSN